MTPATTIRGLIDDSDGEARLVGSVCSTCSTHVFPPQGACPRCGDETTHVALPTSGKLWSWTVQRLRPKPPYRGQEEFEPYALGYVDLGVLKLETRLSGQAVGSWKIGDQVELVTGVSDDASDVWSYAFQAVLR